MSLKKMSPSQLNLLLNNMVYTKQWMTKGIYGSRAKDYSNPFRKMVYDTNEEMNNVLGKLENNSFIQQEQQASEQFVAEVNALKKRLRIK